MTDDAGSRCPPGPPGPACGDAAAGSHAAGSPLRSFAVEAHAGRKIAGWLEEAITTYVSRSALEARHPDVTVWSADTSRTLPDHGYARYAAPLKQLETMIGKPAVMDGLGDLLRHHANETVTKDDLVQCWSRASGRNLRKWAAETLTTAAKDGSEEAP
jgi:aminopeptidase N